jgi:hypothetical protein
MREFVIPLKLADIAVPKSKWVEAASKNIKRHC